MQTEMIGADRQYSEFRDNVLSKQDNGYEGIALSSSEPYKVLIEFYASDSPTAVYCAIDGSAAIYFGSGSGVFEKIQNDTMKQIAKSIVFEAKNVVQSMEEYNEFPQIQKGEVSVYVVTEDKVLGTNVAQDKTVAQETDVWKIYYLASEILGMRMNS